MSAQLFIPHEDIALRVQRSPVEGISFDKLQRISHWAIGVGVLGRGNGSTVDGEVEGLISHFCPN